MQIVARSRWRSRNRSITASPFLGSRLPVGQNPKSQTPSSREIPNFKFQNLPQARRLGAWELELLWGLELGFWSFHSHLSASIGFTCVALRAGSQQANRATAPSNNATAMNVTGSVKLMPKP